MSIKGKVWKYGDDVNTDVIFPGKYTYTITDPKEMKEVLVETTTRGADILSDPININQLLKRQLTILSLIALQLQ